MGRGDGARGCQGIPIRLAAPGLALATAKSRIPGWTGGREAVAVVGWLLVGMLALSLACGGREGPSGSNGPEWVSGIVVEVVDRNFSEIERLRVRGPDGTIWSFTTEGPVGISPSHLREHQVFGQSVTVFYVTKGDVLVAVDVAD